MKGCLTKDVNERKTVHELLEMDFFVDLDDSMGDEIRRRVGKRLEWLNTLETCQVGEEQQTAVATNANHDEKQISDDDKTVATSWSFEDDDENDNDSSTSMSSGAASRVLFTTAGSPLSLKSASALSNILRECCQNDSCGAMGWKKMPSSEELSIHLSDFCERLGIVAVCSGGDGEILGGCEVSLSVLENRKSGLLETTHSHSCRIERLYVRPSRRKEGHGTELLRHVIQKVRDLGYRRIDFDVRNDRTECLKTLERAGGWKKVGVKKEMFSSDESDVLFDGIVYEKLLR